MPGRFLTILWVLLLASPPVFAANITKSYTFYSGQVASATSVNANFDQLYTEMNSKETRITALETGGVWSLNGTSAYYSGGNVGLGLNAPVANLEIQDDNYGEKGIRLNGTNTAHNLTFYSGESRDLIYAKYDNDDVLKLYYDSNITNAVKLEYGAHAAMSPGFSIQPVGSAPTMFFNNNGKVGIGNIAPGAVLDVTGTIRGVGITDLSDERLKHDIRPLTDDLRKILLLRGVSFRWNEKKFDDGKQIGLIAQEVESVYPEMVDTDEKGVKSVQYSHLTAPLIEAVKSIYGFITGLDSRVAALELENSQLKTRLERIEGLLSKEKEQK